MDVQQKLQQGILAAKAGDRETAKTLLVEVVQADQNQVQAWMWLSYVVDGAADKQLCFENILTLDPGNRFAQKGLAWLKGEPQTPPSQPPVPAEPPTPPPQPEPPSLLQVDSPRDEFDNEWLCPYCAALTRPGDETCPGCQKRLVVKTRARPDRSVWLWRGFFLQLYTAAYTLSAALGYYAFRATMRNVPQPLSFWPLYLGLPVDKPAQQINTVLTLFPLWAFWAAIAVALYALGLMMILYLRVPFGHLLYLLNAGLMLTVGVLGVIIPQAGVLRCGGGLGLLLGVVQLVITLNLWKDFTVVETRLRLKVDSDARNTTSLLLSGRKYAGLGMWGNAVIHLRRAAARRPADLSIRLLLIAAYLNLKRFDLAETALQQAEQMDPANVDLQRLRDKLAAAQRAA